MTEKGFSLIETMFALGLVALLAAIAVTMYVGYQESAETAVEESLIAALRSELQAKAAVNEGRQVACDNSLRGC